ncbi:topoisomerase I binding, arginine/serine-rich a isoform X2 [Callorhinchus milii]|uniref:E3 ubiquitin-protein ligase Topors n=2 Tax=Callorhinchus milii TaxID=7868 RepID=A0A4W3IGJ0_CALMI|nr:topoisomerase I binding, arginine/serine-rich a isoform X2 [Callorhinchus milii]|eukprot:gi/632976452/ref/XP_007904802.1/ PREDICTED: E3 ubiquitin-protein ligase Topors isoform X2 [Callorhinchus milii]
MASAAEDLTMDSQFSPKAGTSKIPQGVQADASPDAKCPICLDRFENMSYIDRCFHKFCFRCIQEWSRNKAECPLCKQPFSSIFHSVRTESDFQEYVLKATENGSFGSPDGQRFRYRTTLTRDRRMTFQSRRSLVTSSLPDNGVVFEGLGRQSRSLQGRSLRRMIARLGARRRAQSEGRSVRIFQEQEMVNFRRELYRSGVRVRNVQDGGRYRDISAEFFRRNAACLHRLVPWLKRELCVLFGSHGSVVNIVQHIIMSNITRYDLESEAFQEDLRPFLLSRTDHFLHEFISFARAPFNMEAYDQRANYDCPAPSYEEESDSDLSVITISPEMENIQEEDRPVPNPSEMALSLSQTAWDDETPGPSYSIAETVEQGDSSPAETTVSIETPPQAGPSSQSILIKTDPGSNEESANRSGDDCLIMGYVKPLAERTPELIELSSDTEASVPDTDNKVVKHPVHLRFHSSQSSSSNSSNKISGFSSSSTPSSPSARSSESKEQWKRKKNKRRKHGRSKREEHRGHKKSCHSGDSTSSSCRDRTRISSRSKSTSKGRSVLRSHSRDGHDSQRHQQARSRDRGALTHPESSRDGHRDKGWKRRSNRDRSSSRDHAGSGSSDSRTHWNWEQRRRRWKERDRKSSGRSLKQPRHSDSLVYRPRDRSRSRNRGYAIAREERRSRSRERMYSYMREYQERSRGYSYQWEKYSYHSRTNDGHDSVTRTRAHYRRGSPSSDYRIQSSSESTSFRSPSSHREDVFYHYGSYRSRSPSSRFRVTGRTEKMRQEKPGGKRKYKTHYLESSSNKRSTNTALQVTNVSEGHAIPRNESASPGRLSQCSSSRKSSHREPHAVPGHQAPLNRLREKDKRSSSVEIVYEGKVTEASKRHKKRKKHKKKLKKDQSSEECAERAPRSPIIITIDSHSDSDAVVVSSAQYDTSDLGPADTTLRPTQCETCEDKSTAEPEEDKDSLNTAVPASSQISSESLDICSLSTDSDFGPENPSAQVCSDQEDVEPASDTDTHRSMGVQEQEHESHSNRTPLPKSSPDRPPLILKIPKRFLNRTNLFHQSAGNA